MLKKYSIFEFLYSIFEFAYVVKISVACICIPYSSFIPLSSIPYSELKFASPSVFKTQERRTQQPSNWLTFLCSKLHEPTLRKIFQTSVLTIILFDKAPFGGKKGTLCKFSIECKLKRPLLASPCKKFD